MISAQQQQCARPVLIVMAKAPVIGGGKTRLAAEIGRVEAWRINRLLQARTLRAACDSRWRTLLCVAPRRGLALSLPGVWPAGIERFGQGEGDLGARIARALAPRRRVAVIGVDCAGLRTRHIASAFDALAHAPFALGPSEDGGFWVLAARSGRAAARAMAGVRWSSEHAFADVACNLGGKFERLARLRDVDTLSDLKSVRAQ